MNSNNQTGTNGDPHAENYARDKLNAIYESGYDPLHPPAPKNPTQHDGVTSRVEPLYRREEEMQETYNQTPYVSQPDHQLPTPKRSSSGNPLTRPKPAEKPVSQQSHTSSAGHTDTASQKISKKEKAPFLKPFIRAVIVTSFVFLIYNAPLVTGQIQYYITPANNEATPIVITNGSTPVSKEPRLIISKLNIDIPVVWDEPSYDEKKIQAALDRGAVHYGTTAFPGELGNTVLLGHSSGSPWAGKFSTAFTILRRLENGDTFVVHYEGRRYIYEVYQQKIIEPNDFSVIDQNVQEPIITLITCDPPGANWRRLIIQARQISPDPTNSKKPEIAPGTPERIPGTIPSTPPSLWDKAIDWLF